MHLPCSHLSEGSCSVYEQRPHKCGHYQCILLEKIIYGEVHLTQAKQIIDVTKEQSKWLLSNLTTIIDVDTLNNEINLRDNLYNVYRMLANRLKSNENVVFTTLEQEFCLHALDYLKGLKKYFYNSSLLFKYNTLIKQMS